ncbi:helix-turn-helix domain-containing protein [Nostoc sp. MG11]|uniref:helix-turn-helix domain-containing protein n=1 Tax=Nostoc sp. MG11 TaxID=2721166 RepID=UPI001D00AC4D|nr:helix-turn-helix transcriptional regulator [Nostoc sp. MG11]
MNKQMIVWKLNEVMARQRIKNKDLATFLGIDENSVSRLRKTDEMPRLTAERLNGLCIALGCEPGDLIVFVPDDDAGTKDNSPKQIGLLSSEKRISSKTLNSNTQGLAA